MPEWMVKGEALSDYLQACKDADSTTVETDKVLMKMFNTPEQYQTVMKRLVELFGPLDGMRICEIGGGYGGQAKAIFSSYKPGIYHIIDLPEVCELQRHYLWPLPVGCYDSIPIGYIYDLVISNYALSEIPDNKYYIDEVLRKSRHGYITCNTDLVKLDFPHSCMADIPGERRTNYVLYW